MVSPYGTIRFAKTGLRTSRMAVATGDSSFRDKADYVVAELAKCQIALKQDGYLAGFPAGVFDRLEGKPGDSGGVGEKE